MCSSIILICADQTVHLGELTARSWLVFGEGPEGEKGKKMGKGKGGEEKSERKVKRGGEERGKRQRRMERRERKGKGGRKEGEGRNFMQL